jgi:ribosomal protein L37E
MKIYCALCGFVKKDPDDCNNIGEVFCLDCGDYTANRSNERYCVECGQPAEKRTVGKTRTWYCSNCGDFTNTSRYAQ